VPETKAEVLVRLGNRLLEAMRQTAAAGSITAEATIQECMAVLADAYEAGYRAGAIGFWSSSKQGG
jgi:hypothetical protein